MAAVIVVVVRIVAVVEQTAVVERIAVAAEHHNRGSEAQNDIDDPGAVAPPSVLHTVVRSLVLAYIEVQLGVR